MTGETILSNAKKNMDGVLEHTIKKFSTLKVGMAQSDFLDSVQVEAYGQFMPIKQVATISVADNFSLIVNPFDKNNIKHIVKAIQEANLGVGVVAEAVSIRVTMPKITEERRKEYVKILYKYAEDSKISIRGYRHNAMDEIKQEKKNGLSEDVIKHLEKEIQKLTDDFIKKIEDNAKKKEQEILKV